jgi:hypothetical protein
MAITNPDAVLLIEYRMGDEDPGDVLVEEVPVTLGRAVVVNPKTPLDIEGVKQIRVLLKYNNPGGTLALYGVLK